MDGGLEAALLRSDFVHSYRADQEDEFRPNPLRHYGPERGSWLFYVNVSRDLPNALIHQCLRSLGKRWSGIEGRVVWQRVSCRGCHRCSPAVDSARDPDFS